MKTLIENITNKRYTLAEEQLKEKLATIRESKLLEMKKMVAAKLSEEEQIDEVGPDTLRSYLKGAKKSYKKENKKFIESGFLNPKRKDYARKAQNREDGTNLAKSKLTGEPYHDDTSGRKKRAKVLAKEGTDDKEQLQKKKP
jgi:hypothetical protein